MNSHTLGLLEFERVRAEVEEYCVSEQGRAHLRVREISSDEARITMDLDQAVAYRELLESGTSVPDTDFPDIGPLLDSLDRKGSVFEPEELAWLGRYILSATRLISFVRKECEAAEVLAIVEDAPDLAGLTRLIFRIIDMDGGVKEKAIPELVAIRSRIRSLEREVERSVSELMAEPDVREMLQSNVATVRNGRTVVPMKASHRERVRGIVHEVSSSGATAFVEPEAIVQKNNEIVEREHEYRRELARKLRELAAEVGRRATEIETLERCTSEVDALQARARYAVVHTCRRAAMKAGTLDLHDARHPLLGRNVVPISMRLDADSRMVIVTGPNTGGKTVTLKTAGLLAAMNQFGMEIPAREDSAMGVFNDVFADIGDEQSLEQSLSTFSAHIENLVRIVGSATDRSLVLLDELGAGTDPEEGVAIAMALLDHFIDTGSLTLATTHHGILKHYGYARPGVRNASMEFDTDALRPTFRIILGIPGRSYALEIAARRGMPGNLVERAHDYLSEERSDVAALVQNLTEQEHALHRRAEEQRQAEQQLAERRRETDLEALRVRQRELQLKEQGLSHLESFLTESRREIEGAVKELRERGGGLDQARAAREVIRRVEERVEEQAAEINSARKILDPGDGGEISVGGEVLIRSTGRRGRVVRQARGDRWVVETDTLRAELAAHQLQPVEDSSEALEVSFKVSTPGARRAKLSIDLRGQFLDQAVGELDAQIESSILSGLREFSVIHGKGEGVLQRGIHERLKEDPNIADYYFAKPGEGGFGKTIVRLKG